jgi:hypothetical protein
MVGRSKKDTFAYVKDRIWKRINGWRSRPLSRAGKEVMIKSVLQAIPAYIMNIYLLPDTLIVEIERMINAFWWGEVIIIEVFDGLPGINWRVRRRKEVWDLETSKVLIWRWLRNKDGILCTSPLPWLREFTKRGIFLVTLYLILTLVIILVLLGGAFGGQDKCWPMGVGGKLGMVVKLE